MLVLIISIGILVLSVTVAILNLILVKRTIDSRREFVKLIKEREAFLDRMEKLLKGF